MFTAEGGNSIGALMLATVGRPLGLFDTITAAYIRTVDLSPARINGSAGASNQIPAGTILVYQTSEGRYGKMEIVSYGYDLIVRWLTYNDDGTVYSQGDNLVVHGTWQCDLDLGVEGDASADFWWEQVTSVERYLVPQNGARFALLRY